jgi:hypothetical protein
VCMTFYSFFLCTCYCVRDNGSRVKKRRPLDVEKRTQSEEKANVKLVYSTSLLRSILEYARQIGSWGNGRKSVWSWKRG